MIKSFSIVIIIFFCTIFDNAHALIIRYNITGGIDSEGYNFSGHVDINSEYESTAGIHDIQYNITQFLFQSDAGIFSGYSGYLGLCMPLPGWSTAHFYPSYTENYTGKENLPYWVNGSTGVYFDDMYNEYSDSTTLPETITINPWWGDYSTSYNWGPGGTEMIRLTKASEPVPEPATMLLLSGGLLGLAVFRKKFKK